MQHTHTHTHIHSCTTIANMWSLSLYSRLTRTHGQRLVLERKVKFVCYCGRMWNLKSGTLKSLNFDTTCINVSKWFELWTSSSSVRGMIKILPLRMDVGIKCDNECGKNVFQTIKKTDILVVIIITFLKLQPAKKDLRKRKSKSVIHLIHCIYCYKGLSESLKNFEL